MQHTNNTGMQKFHTYINGLPWSHDHQVSSTQKAFAAALENNISRRTAIFEVFDRIERAGGGLTWFRVKQLWNDAIDEAGGYSPAPVGGTPKQVAPVLKQTVPVIVRHEKNGTGHASNGNGHHKATSGKPQDRGGSSLVSYYR